MCGTLSLSMAMLIRNRLRIEISCLGWMNIMDQPHWTTKAQIFYGRLPDGAAWLIDSNNNRTLHRRLYRETYQRIHGLIVSVSVSQSVCNNNVPNLRISLSLKRRYGSLLMNSRSCARHRYIASSWRLSYSRVQLWNRSCSSWVSTPFTGPLLCLSACLLPILHTSPTPCYVLGLTTAPDKCLLADAQWTHAAMMLARDWN